MSSIHIKVEGITVTGGREFKFADISNVRLASGAVMSFGMFSTEGSYEDMMHVLQTGKKGLFGPKRIDDLLVAIDAAKKQHPEKNQGIIVSFLSSTEGNQAEHIEGLRLVLETLEKKHPRTLCVLFGVPVELFFCLMEEAGAHELLDRLS